MSLHNELLTQVVRFNWLPASYVDASWLSQWLLPEQMMAIRSNTDATRSLNRFLLEYPEPLEIVPTETFSDPVLQLMLKPVESVHHLVRLAGLALNYQRIKQVICRQQQKLLKDVIGEAGYRFALERAPLMVGSLEMYLDPKTWIDSRSLSNRSSFNHSSSSHSSSSHYSSSHYSSSHSSSSHQATSAVTEKESMTDRILEPVMASGLTLMALVTSHMPEPARQRLQYFFSVEQAQTVQRCWEAGAELYVKEPNTVAEVQGKARGLLFKIAQEIDTQWKPFSV
ncbi:SctK family type III secretion system sorting platform protein [Hahella ganghwensis]|uniref:SctK family type III secretion system sorting platform protein n=1 Tax=Hahella ganghwensis TaxID=286420 RepID=UPI00037A0050|nr:SctK family type III secretion system sorting platform protein [Hahella ganghwensis]